MKYSNGCQNYRCGFRGIWGSILPPIAGDKKCENMITGSVTARENDTEALHFFAQD